MSQTAEARPIFGIPTLYAITKNNHIYACNDNVKMLQQMLSNGETRDITVKASPDYHLNEKTEPVECKMITS